MAVTKTKKDIQNLSTPERASLALSQLRSKQNADSAHFFRTSYRRLQTWLGTLDDRPFDKCEKRAIKYLDKVLRACGKLRDTELHIKMLKNLEVDNDAKARNTIEQILKRRRDKRKDAVSELLQMKAKLQDVQPTLEHFKTVCGQNNSARSSPQQPTHMHEALQRYAQYVNERPAVTTETLHEYRLACKEFRYRAELDGEAAQSVVKLFKDVQDTIGEWHDWQLLLELSKKELAKRPSKLLTKIEETTAAKLAEAFRAVEEIEPKLLSAVSETSQRKPVRSARNGGRRISHAA
jgi:CHAD domain-containing protein